MEALSLLQTLSKAHEYRMATMERPQLKSSQDRDGGQSGCRPPNPQFPLCYSLWFDDRRSAWQIITTLLQLVMHGLVEMTVVCSSNRIISFPGIGRLSLRFCGTLSTYEGIDAVIGSDAGRRELHGVEVGRESVGKNRGWRSSLHFDGLTVTRVGWSNGLLKTPSPRPRCKNFHKFSNVNVWVTRAKKSHDHNRSHCLKLFLGCRPRAPLVSSTRSLSRLVTSMRRSLTQVLSFSQKLNALGLCQRECMRLMRNGTRSGQSGSSGA